MVSTIEVTCYLLLHVTRSGVDVSDDGIGPKISHDLLLAIISVINCIAHCQYIVQHHINKVVDVGVNQNRLTS